MRQLEELKRMNSEINQLKRQHHKSKTDYEQFKT